MGFTIAAEDALAVTQVPNWFICSYMPTAEGHFVKIYLYLLMLCQHPLLAAEQSVSSLADCMECTENDVFRALRFWKKENLLDFEEKDGEISSIVLTAQPDASNAGNAADESAAAIIRPEVTAIFRQPQKANKTVLPNKQTYTPLQAEALKNDIEIEQAISSVEQLLGSTVSIQHLQLILYFMCDIGFSKELILAMYQTALKKGKNSPSYIEAIGISWAKQGIRTVSEAKEEASAFSGRYSLVSKALGIQRSLTPFERAIIDEWDKYSFSDAIITEACKRSVLKTGGINFSYISGILENWAKHNVISLSDIEQCDEDFKRQKKANKAKRSTHTTAKNQFQNFPQRTYSNEEFDNLEKQLLRSVQLEKG